MSDTERREAGGGDLRRVYDKIEEVGRAVYGMDTRLQVHIAKYETTANKVEEHEGHWRELEKIKNKGLLYMILAFLGSGAFGGGIAHLARKFTE